MVIGRVSGLGTLCHTCWFTYQQTVLKIFPGPDYLHSGDGTIWIWHFRVKLYMWLTVWSCCSSIAVPYGDWEGAWYKNSFSWLRVCLSAEDAKKVSLLWLSPLSGWGRLPITFFLAKTLCKITWLLPPEFFWLQKVFFHVKLYTVRTTIQYWSKFCWELWSKDV